MSYVLFATSVLVVGARELKFKSAFDNSVSPFTSNDLSSPIIGNTEDASALNKRSTVAPDHVSAASRRRAPNLLENIRRQLMQNNYDYINKESEENTTKLPTSTSATSATSMLTLEGIVEDTLTSSQYYNKLHNVRHFGQVVRARSSTQMASVDVPLHPMIVEPISITTNLTASNEPTASALVFIPLTTADPAVNQYRSFDEAYNTQSSKLDQTGLGMYPKREVYKKDLLYYVGDYLLNTGLHLRRNNDFSSEVNQLQKQEGHYDGSLSDHLFKQSDHDEITPTYDISQQDRDQRRSADYYGTYRSNTKHTHKRRGKNKYKKRNQSLDGLNRRAKLYGLKYKQLRNRDTYMRRSNTGAKENYVLKEANDIRSNHQNVQITSAREDRTEVRSQRNINDRQSDKSNNRRGNHLSARQNTQGDLTVNQNNTINELQEVDTKDDQSMNQYNSLYGDQHSKAKKPIARNRHDANKQGPKRVKEVQDNTENEDNTQTYLVHQDDDQLDDINVSRRSSSEPYQSFDDTTTNNKYKLLKVQSLDGSRRSGADQPHHILQERGSQGLALISLDQAPFPQFQLPQARRQYMQNDDARKYSTRHRSTRL